MQMRLLSKHDRGFGYGMKNLTDPDTRRKVKVDTDLGSLKTVCILHYNHCCETESFLGRSWKRPTRWLRLRNT